MFARLPPLDEAMRRAFGCSALAVALLLLTVAPVRALPVLGHRGRWLTDPQGRAVVVHGVQVDKFLPGSVVEGIDLNPQNVRFIAAAGFDAARVSLAYAGVEPRLGDFDDGYVGSYLRFDRRLARAGVYDLVDMMQGEYSAAVGGWGFPDWMTVTHGAPNNREPFARGYLDNPAENSAWDSFYANAPAADGAGVQDHYAAGLRRLAAQFARAPGLLGFEVLNEPWPGSAWPLCASPAGCPAGGFDQTALTAFTNRMVAALRAGDPGQLVVYEPNLLFDYGADTRLAGLRDPNLVFAFHDYCIGRAPGLTALPDPLSLCGIDENLVMADADRRSAQTGDALLMDEWSNSTDLALVDRMAAEADRHVIGWTAWAYEDCCDSPAAIVRDGAKPPTAPGNLNTPVLRALARPYPRLVAGTPQSWSFDPASRAFRFAFSTSRVGGGSFPRGIATEVELPALQYPTGYTVAATGARVVSPPDANRLRLVAEPGAAAVRVTVTPADHHPTAPGPFAWPAGAQPAPTDCPPTARLRVRLRKPARRVVVTVDGVRTATRRGHELHRITLPPGLADGSSVILRATLPGGRRATEAHRVLACRLR